MYEKMFVIIKGKKYLLDYNINAFCVEDLIDLFNEEDDFDAINEELNIDYDSDLTLVSDIKTINLDIKR